MKITYIEILEIVVIITTLMYNYYLIKQKIICWLFGFLASIAGLAIFYEKQLPGQVILHVFYAIMAIYGYYFWGKNKQELKVKQWPLALHVYIIVTVSGLTILLGNFVLPRFIENVNYLDICITLFCFVATFKEAHKILSAWIYWAVLNIASLFLYLQSGLYIYALLMFVYTLLSIKGYLIWQKDLNHNKQAMS